MGNPNTPSGNIEQQAKDFIQRVQAGATPPSHEPLTPDVAVAVEKNMANLDEANRAKIRAALDALKLAAKPPESDEGSLSSLFEGAQSDLMKGAPKLLDAIIDPQLDQWKSATGAKLSNEQRMNIKLAIIDRIVSGAASEALFGSLKSKLNTVSEKFSKIDPKNISIDSIDSLTKEFSFSSSDNDKDGTDSGMEGTIKKQVEKILSETLDQIRGAYESNPQPAGFSDLLMHPKALADYKTGEDISALLARSGSATLTRIAYREGIKQKILSLEGSILTAEKKKDKVMDLLTKLPDFASDKLFGAFEWLFKIPIIGDLIATFFGYKSGKTLIEDLKTETKERKSMLALMEYGMKKDDAGTLTKGEENGNIKFLENIDFTEIKYKDLKSFYKLMKENGIDTTAKDFWKTVFGEGKIEVGEGEKKKVIRFPEWDPKVDTTAQKIITKLNKTQIVTATPPPVPAVAPPVSVPDPAPNGAAPKLTPGGDTPPAVTPPPPASPGDPTTVPVTPPVAVVAKSKEFQVQSVSREQLLVQAFSSADKFPFTFGSEVVSFSNKVLEIGSQKYRLSGNGIVDAHDIDLSTPGKIKLSFSIIRGSSITSTRERSEIITNLEKVTAMTPNATLQIPSAEDIPRIQAEIKAKGDKATKEELEFLRSPSWIVVTRTA